MTDKKITEVKVPEVTGVGEKNSLYYYEEMKYEPERVEKYLTAVYEKCKAPTIIEYNKYGLNKIREKVPIRTILITCNLMPEYEYSDAWDIAIRERDKIVKDLLERHNEIKFTISTIEHHHTVSAKMLGVMKEEETAEEVSIHDENNVTTIATTTTTGLIKLKISKQEEPNSENIESNQGDSNDKTKKKTDKASVERSTHSVYLSKTRDEFVEGTKGWKESKKITRDMTNRDKIVTYYNIFQTMRYLHGEASREESFEKWINSTHEVMKEYMKLCNFKGKLDAKLEEKLDVKWEPIQLGLITRHKKIGNNLLGYPHIHIAVAYAGSTNPTKLRTDIYNYLMEKKLFDPDVAVTLKKEAVEDGNAIVYVVKNHMNAYVHSKLVEHKHDGNIVQMHINNEYEGLYKEYGRGFVEKHDKAYYKPIRMNVYVRKEVTIGKTNLVLIKEKEPMKPEIDPEKNNYNRTLAHILQSMNENELVICEGEIYKKRQGSKMTYIPYMKIEAYVDSITTVEPYTTIANKWKGDIVKIMNLRDEDVEKIAKLKCGHVTGSYQVEFPRIKMDYRMIEYKDFYFNTLTTEIYKTQTKYYCHYYSAVSLENLEAKMATFVTNSDWMKILGRNNMSHRIIHALLFELLRPRHLKAPVPLIYGESDAGKSTLITPFRNYYPENKVSTFLKTLSEYHIADLMDNRKMAILEEGNSILNDNSTRTLLLTSLEGSKVVSNRKHGEIKNINQEANMVIICNVLNKDTYMEDDAIMGRLYPVGDMKAMKEKKVVTDTIAREEPYIYLYTGLEFMRLGKGADNNDFFTIHELLTEDHENEIEEIKSYYSKRKEAEAEAVDIYSEEYMREQNTNMMKKKDDQRSQSYEPSRILAVSLLRSHPTISGHGDIMSKSTAMRPTQSERAMTTMLANIATKTKK